MRRALLLLTLLFIGVSLAQYRDLPSLNTTVLETVETDHLTISRYVLDFPNFDVLVAQAEEVYTYVSERMGTELEDKLAVSVYEPMAGACPVRGSLSFSLELEEGEAVPETLDGIYEGTPELSIFADETTSPEQILGVLAHELGHALHHQGFAPFPALGGFTEGLATWAAGSHWTDWQQSVSLSDSVRTYFENGTFLTLQDDIELQGVYPNDAAGACLARRNTLYTEWAAFVEFLLGRYGLEPFRELLSTSEPIYQEEEITFTAPDFLGVYGKSFEALEQEWLESTALRQIPGQPLFLTVSTQETEALKAAFTASLTSGEAPLTVEFDASDSTGSSELSYEWRFYDGDDRVFEETITRTFTEPSEYGVLLIVTDETGSDTASQVIEVSGNTPPKRVQTPYTIDSKELEGGEVIVAMGNVAYVESSDTIGIRNPNTGNITSLTLMDEEDDVVAQDWFIPGVKENVEFNARNAVLVAAAEAPDIRIVPVDIRVELYQRFDQHPDFQEAVERVRAAKGLGAYDDEDIEVRRLINDIAVKTAQDYAIEKGWVDLEKEIIIPPDNSP